MDTKWKNRKKAVSFIIFFLGVSLVVGNGMSMLKIIPEGAMPHLDRVLEEDYQQSRRFQRYICGRLEVFLSMASAGSDPLGYGNYYGAYYDDYSNYFGAYYDDYGNYYDGYYDNYGGGYYDLLREALAEELEEKYAQGYEERTVEGDFAAEPKEGTGWYEDIERHYEEVWENDLNEQGGFFQERELLTGEQRKEIARSYHDRIKGNRNLLYSILYDGEVLYSNLEPSGAADGVAGIEGMTGAGGMAFEEMSLKGYNFLLHFDGEKVRIVKDGKEVDVYGDGYYREENPWYVPGYRNFQADEGMKKAEVYIAAAKEPLLYTEGVSGRGGYRQVDNSLYWMARERLENRDRMLRSMWGLAAGLALLLTMFAPSVRQKKREAKRAIARFQGKIWVECKAALLILLVYFVLVKGVAGSVGYNIWQEIAYAYEYNYVYAIEEMGPYYGELLLGALPPFLFVILFWGIYLTVNDLHYNKKIWRHGLAAKVYRTFTARELKRPLSRRMAHRNAVAFTAAALCGVLLAGAGIFGALQRESAGQMWLLILPGLLCFLLAQYFIGAKNMELARDIEVLCGRISDIHDGNYESRNYKEAKGTEQETEQKEQGTEQTEQETEQTEQETEQKGRGAERKGQRTEHRGQGAGQLAGRDLEETMAQLEDIRQGMAGAVEEQMKSERMKVELIANVSHDIKTPLTSIISYVQFLKQEEDLPEHIKDYVSILDEKSQRLKNMVQDVFAVSKAASGELPMQMEPLDFGKLLCQTMADMEEQIKNSKVTFRTELPKGPVMILADGQRMYRVFQNLFQNAIQYSLDGSRVYVALRSDKAMAVASVKNTSRLELDKDRDFAERFARGDQSRTDGGSGLGLSIAQSFTEACGGQFYWEINADLFVVTVSLPQITR